MLALQKPQDCEGQHGRNRLRCWLAKSLGKHARKKHGGRRLGLPSMGVGWHAPRPPHGGLNREGEASAEPHCEGRCPANVVSPWLPLSSSTARDANRPGILAQWLRDQNLVGNPFRATRGARGPLYAGSPSLTSSVSDCLGPFPSWWAPALPRCISGCGRVPIRSRARAQARAACGVEIENCCAGAARAGSARHGTARLSQKMEPKILFLLLLFGRIFEDRKQQASARRGFHGRRSRDGPF